MDHKRRNYLINTRFQLKFCILATLIIALCCSIYPLSFYGIMTGLVESISALSPELTANLEENKRSILYFFIRWQIIISSLIFVICIFFSHKIAGPIYRIRKSLQQVQKEGKWETMYTRKGDYFPELVSDINRVFEKGNGKNVKSLTGIKEINTCLKDLAVNAPQDKKEALNEIIKKLSEVQKRFDA